MSKANVDFMVRISDAFHSQSDPLLCVQAVRKVVLLPSGHDAISHLPEFDPCAATDAHADLSHLIEDAGYKAPEILPETVFRPVFRAVLTREQFDTVWGP